MKKQSKKDKKEEKREAIQIALITIGMAYFAIRIFVGLAFDI